MTIDEYDLGVYSKRKGPVPLAWHPKFCTHPPFQVKSGVVFSTNFHPLGGNVFVGPLFPCVNKCNK